MKTRKKFGVYAAILGIVCTLCVGIDLTTLGRLVESRIELPILFSARERVGASPTIDPRIKIIALDDSSVRSLKATDLSFTQWSSLIEALANAKPKSILIDKVFGHIFEEKTDVDKFRASMERATSSTQVSLAGFLARHTNPFRSQFDTNRLHRKIASNDIGLEVRNGVFYGPDESLGDTFNVGHINDFSDGYVLPLMRLDGDQIIPHLSLSTLQDAITVNGKQITLLNNTVPVDTRGLTLADFPSINALYARTKAIAPYVKKAIAGEPITTITADDHLIIMPLHFSGNVDIRRTPIGEISAGYYHAALLNSALTGNWLAPAGYWRFLVVAFVAALGILAGAKLRQIYFGAVLIFGIGTIFTVSVMLFVWGRQVIPWALPSCAFALAAVSAFGYRARVQELQSVRLSAALKGLVSEKNLKLIIDNPQAINSKPVEKVASLMFIDIAGFSLLAEEHPPDGIFNHIKQIFSRIATRIHEHGGTIDRTLGDGLFAFFGYSLDGSEPPGNQADDAIDCAIAIQNDNIRELIEASKNGGFVTPLRIGINTASVYLGDIGSEGRVDFTVIGNGVNYAKRLEAACDLNAIMLSPTTLNLASKYRMSTPGMTKRLIQIKHHAEAIEAIEFDPLAGSTQKSEATKAWHKVQHAQRKDMRWPVLEKDDFIIQTDFGAGKLYDFSTRGLAVEMDTFLAKGVSLRLRINSRNGFLGKVLDTASIDYIECEVRWGRPLGSKFLHGLSIRNLNDRQLNELTTGLRHCMSQAGTDNVRSIKAS